ncbi:MAG: NADH:flavin oxidoreductase [Nannocystaceae bacterium]
MAEPRVLLTPLALRCGATLRNRVALAPLTNQQSHDDGSLSDDERAWLVRRAAGGFGLVETCASHVNPTAKGFDGQLGIYDDRLLPGLRRLAGEIADEGGLGLVQLYHGGVRSPSRLTGVQPLSASAFDEDRPGFERPRPATDAELRAIIDDFAAAARRAEAAGFAGVEVHGAHGYLFSQFLSRAMNTRDDAWGGDLEGRVRLLREATRAVRQATRAGFIVGVRLSPEDFGFARGLDLDESLQVAAWLAEDGVDFVHLSLWDVRKPTQKYPTEHPLPLFRERLPADVKIVVAGKVWTADEAELVLEAGADVVALGRAAILNPDWPKQVAADPGFAPVRGPLTPAELRAQAISDSFVDYLRRFRDVVAD